MHYNNTNDTKNLIQMFSTEGYSLEDGVVDEIERIVEFYSLHTRHQYHVISRFVNERMSESEDAISYILNNIDYILNELHYKKEEYEPIIEKASESKLSVEDIVLNLEKLYDHIALEEERIMNNATVIRKSKSEIEDSVINQFNSITDDFRRKVDETSNSLNANIITVVGLFSAIIFVFFGGITSLSDLLNGIWEIREKKELTYPLIAILVTGFIIFNVVFLLLYVIAKIVDKNIGSSVSGCTARWYDVEEINDGCYGVFWGDKQYGKCYRDRRKAEKQAEIRRCMSRMKDGIMQIFKKMFLRFPYVTVINVVFIAGIVCLYFTL